MLSHSKFILFAETVSYSYLLQLKLPTSKPITSELNKQEVDMFGLADRDNIK